MTATTHLLTTDRARLHPIGVRGQLVITTYQQITRFLSGRLSQEHARLFAEPVLGANTIDWFTDAGSSVKPLREAEESIRTAALQNVQRLVGDIQKLSSELKTSQQTDQQLIGEILGHALIYPSEDYLFLADDQLVVTCWGVKPNDPMATPQSLARLGREVKVETRDDLARASRPIQSRPIRDIPAVPPPAVPVPVVTPGGDIQPDKAAEPTDQPADKPKRSWRWLQVLLGCLLALLLIVLLLLGLRGCVGAQLPLLGGLPQLSPGWPNGGSGRQPEDSLATARNREDLLRQELAQLRSELARRQRSCTPPGKPK